MRMTNGQIANHKLVSDQVYLYKLWLFLSILIWTEDSVGNVGAQVILNIWSLC